MAKPAETSAGATTVRHFGRIDGPRAVTEAAGDDLHDELLLTRFRLSYGPGPTASEVLPSAPPR